MDIYAWILTLAIISGQLIKLPLSQNSGITLLDIAVLTLCVFGLLRLKFKLKKPPLPLAGALFFIITAVLSLVLTPLYLTIPQFLSSFFYTVRFASYILLGWLIFSGAFPTLKDKIIHIFILSGICLTILGLIQFVFIPDLRFLTSWDWDPHYFRTVSTFLDPNFAGAFFVLTLLLLTTSYLGGRNTMTPRVFYITFAIVYIALLTTFSRSSYLMFLVSGLTFSFLKKSIKLTFLTIILFLVLLLSFQIYIRAVNRVTPLDRSQTASFRFSTWQQGFSIFQKNPILGVGYNAYSFALRQYNMGDEQFLGGKGATTNDSSLLHILSTTGILGFFAYLVFIAGMIKTKSFSLIAAITGLLVHSLFVNSLFYPFMLIWIILSLSALYAKPPIK